jgi:hypothetical protein
VLRQIKKGDGFDMGEEDEKNTVEAKREEGVSETIKGKDWTRILFVILLSIVLYLEVVYATFLLVLVNVVLYLIKGSVDTRIVNICDALITVVSGTLRYILFRTDDKPWPLSPWPAKEVTTSNDSTATAQAVAEKREEEGGEEPSKD